MQNFVWNQRFETGINTVDEQHRHLVDLINRIVMLGSDGKSDIVAAVDAILGELGNYASYHFDEEESLMAERGVASRHVEMHQLEHSRFIERVGQIWDARDAQDKPVEVLENFLTSWLTEHILEVDHLMARQIELIGKGMSPDAAYRTTLSADGRPS